MRRLAMKYSKFKKAQFKGLPKNTRFDGIFPDHAQTLWIDGLRFRFNAIDLNRNTRGIVWKNEFLTELSHLSL